MKIKNNSNKLSQALKFYGFSSEFCAVEDAESGVEELLAASRVVKPFPATRTSLHPRAAS